MHSEHHRFIISAFTRRHLFYQLISQQSPAVTSGPQHQCFSSQISCTLTVTRNIAPIGASYYKVTYSLKQVLFNVCTLLKLYLQMHWKQTYLVGFGTIFWGRRFLCCSQIPYYITGAESELPYQLRAQTPTSFLTNKSHSIIILDENEQSQWWDLRTVHLWWVEMWHRLM